MASPAEGRNQYGYWDNRGGTSVWTWLPEYLILRDLLSPRYYQPIPSYEWGRYQQARRYGQTYYGRDESGAPKYGSHGTFTAQSYANSRYVQSGGFSGSKYSSSGGFSGSKYGSGGSERFGIFGVRTALRIVGVRQRPAPVRRVFERHDSFGVPIPRDAVSAAGGDPVIKNSHAR